MLLTYVQNTFVNNKVLGIIHSGITKLIATSPSHIRTALVDQIVIQLVFRLFRFS